MVTTSRTLHNARDLLFSKTDSLECWGSGVSGRRGWAPWLTSGLGYTAPSEEQNPPDSGHEFIPCGSEGSTVYDLASLPREQGFCGKPTFRTWCDLAREDSLPGTHCPCFNHPSPLLHTEAAAWNVSSSNYLASMPRSLSSIHFSRLLSSSGQDLLSPRKHVNISSPLCPSHHGNYSQCVFMRKAPGSQHAQTSWTENSTVYKRRVFGVPSGPEKNTGFAKIYLPSKLCSHKCAEIQTHICYWLNCLFSPGREKIHRDWDTLGVFEWKQIYHSLTLRLLSQFDREVWIKRDTSMAIKRKPRVELQWMIKSHVLTIPSGLQHFSLEYHCNCATAPFIIYNCLFSSQIKICLKVHLGLVIPQLRVSRSFQVICNVSNVIMLQAPKPVCKEIYLPDSKKLQYVLTKTKSLQGHVKEKETTVPPFHLLPGVCDSPLWHVNIYVYFVRVLLIVIMIAYYSFQGNSCHCNASLPTQFPFSCWYNKYCVTF